MNIPFMRSPLPPWTIGLALGVAAAPPSALAQATAPLPASAVAAALAMASEAAAVLAPPGARVQALPGALDSRLALAPCARVQPYLASGVPTWGRTRVGLRCLEGSVRWNVLMPVTVQVWAPAAVVTAALPAGARLAPEHLQRTEVDWAASPQPPQADPQALAGRTLARAVSAGQPLLAADLQARQWFAAGDTVRITAGGSGFAVSTEGEALTPGVEGQNAKVRTEAGRVLVARPVGERRVELNL